MGTLFSKIGNFFTSLLLRSPLHPILSRDFAVITVTGRRSRKRYTTPVNYSRQGDTITVFSQRQRTWWRNLIGGGEVSILVQGQTLCGRGEVIETCIEEMEAAMRQAYPMLKAGQISELAPRMVLLRIKHS
jgi:hypothetical protein